ncbi:hypothetical protein ABHI18_012650, partial [Aspergillus niger]
MAVDNAHTIITMARSMTEIWGYNPVYFHQLLSLMEWSKEQSRKKFMLSIYVAQFAHLADAQSTPSIILKGDQVLLREMRS